MLTVFSIQYNMLKGNEPIDYRVSILALNPNDAINTLRQHVKINAIIGVSKECDVHEISSSIRRNIAVDWNKNNKDENKPEFKFEEVFTCDKCGKEFRSYRGMMSHKANSKQCKE